MTTYRTGNHWGVTIVREGDSTGICSDRSCPDRGDHHSTDHAELVAVVVNGDQALAERICALLNAENRAARRKPTDCPRCGDDAPIGRWGVCEPCAIAEGWEAQ